MAGDKDGGVSDKKSLQNSDNADISQDNQQNLIKPDLGIKEAKYNVKENGETRPSQPISSSPKSTSAMRNEENPFSFRHFLKRDLSLPANSTYENTGARPKVYANTVQHSTTKIGLHTETKREKSRPSDTRAKDKQFEGVNHRNNDDTSPSSSVEIEIPLSVVYSDSKHNLYADGSDGPFFNRPNIAFEPLGMPSLPDFVQDHIVEQAYINSNAPISVDLDNLPDFTYNTNYNGGSSSFLRKRNKSSYGNNGDYGYNAYMGVASTSSELGPPNYNITLDLHSGAEASVPMPLDLPHHLSLDLTKSVYPTDRQNVSPRNSFPLDLPPNAGAESMRLPDFLPVHPGRTSPEPEHQVEQLTQIIQELERTRSELFTERSRRSHAEKEAHELRAVVAALRADLSVACTRLGDVRHADRQYAGQLEAAAHRVENNLMDTADRATEKENTFMQLKNEIKKLKEELSTSQEQVRRMRSTQSNAAATLRHATGLTETTLRDLLAGLERFRSLSSTLDTT